MTFLKIIPEQSKVLSMVLCIISNQRNMYGDYCSGLLFIVLKKKKSTNESQFFFIMLK